MAHVYLVFVSLLIAHFSSGYPSKHYISENPEEVGGYFQGDLDLTDEQFAALRSRNGLTSRSKHWPNKLVLYKVSPEIDHAHKFHIQTAIKIIEDASCVRFKEASNTDKNYINITASNTGCHSTVGYQAKVQSMNLQIFPLDKGCFRIGSILHELLHTLGFYHQQSASDRDDYITVVEENIQPGMEYNFQQLGDTENFGISYDYNSVLHYSSIAFSKNGEKTIITKDPNAVIGQRKSLSSKDIAKLNTMYLCPMQT